MLEDRGLEALLQERELALNSIKRIRTLLDNINNTLRWYKNAQRDAIELLVSAESSLRKIDIDIAKKENSNALQKT